MPTTDTLLRMRATDAGFDRAFNEADGWLAFGAAGNRALLWLRRDGATLRAAAAPSDVVAEVGSVSGCESDDTALPAGAAAGWRCRDDLALDALCRRIAMLGHTLPDAPLRRFEEAVEAALDAEPLPRTTERIAEVKQRVGQDLFRQALMEYWGGKCAISRVSHPALLRASHIKPWSECTDAERLDVHNGLLLAAHLDAAFDAGLITIAEDGRVLASETLGEVERRVLGLDAEVRVEGLRGEHGVYLRWRKVRS